MQLMLFFPVQAMRFLLQQRQHGWCIDVIVIVHFGSSFNRGRQY